MANYMSKDKRLENTTYTPSVQDFRIFFSRQFCRNSHFYNSVIIE